MPIECPTRSPAKLATKRRGMKNNLKQYVGQAVFLSFLTSSSWSRHAAEKSHAVSTSGLFGLCDISLPSKHHQTRDTVYWWQTISVHSSFVSCFWQQAGQFMIQHSIYAAIFDTSFQSFSLNEIASRHTRDCVTTHIERAAQKTYSTRLPSSNKIFDPSSCNDQDTMLSSLTIVQTPMEST